MYVHSLDVSVYLCYLVSVLPGVCVDICVTLDLCYQRSDVGSVLSEVCWICVEGGFTLDLCYLGSVLSLHLLLRFTDVKLFCQYYFKRYFCEYKKKFPRI